MWFSTEISEDGHHSVGHTKGYVKVLVPLDNNLPGLVKYVKINSSKRFHVEGEIVENVNPCRKTTTSTNNDFQRNIIPVQNKFIYGSILITGILTVSAIYYLRKK